MQSATDLHQQVPGILSISMQSRYSTDCVVVVIVVVLLLLLIIIIINTTTIIIIIFIVVLYCLLGYAIG